MSISSPFSVGKLFEHRCVQMVAVFFKKKGYCVINRSHRRFSPVLQSFSNPQNFKLIAGIEGMHLS